MAKEWSRSTLAPIYALVTSFLLVFLLGAAFSNYSKPAPVAPNSNTAPVPQPMIITFKIDAIRQGQDPAMGVEKVIIRLQDPNMEISVDQTEAGKWSYSPINSKPFWVCLKLKKGWSVTAPKAEPTEPTNARDSNNLWCTKDPVESQDPIEFILGSGR